MPAVTEVTITPDANDPESLIKTFGEIEYGLDDVGHTYVYTLREAVPDEAVNPDGVTYGEATDEQKAAGGFVLNGVEYDSTVTTITVTISDNGDGTLTVTRTPELAAYEFENIYSAEGDITFEGRKTMTGREMTDNDVFTFIVAETGTTNEWTVYNDGDEIQFPTIEYTLEDLGEHTYVVTEVVPGDAVNADGIRYEDATDEQKAAGGFVLNGVKYDSTEYTVVVTVTDNGDGTLKAEGSDNFRTLNFVNPYDAEGEITFVGSKAVTGREMTEEDKFDFTLFDGSGTEIETVQNEGSVFIFSPLQYTLEDVGEYQYVVQETSEDGNGITVDHTIYHITVTVSDNGDGTLSVTSVTDEGVDTDHLAFVNPYDASGKITFEGTKTLKGRKLKKEDVFTFTVSEMGTDNVWTATNDASGHISYPEITYGLEDEGVHVYTVREMPTSIKNIKIDTNVYTVTVTVSDNGDGTLNVVADKDCKNLNFVNTYDYKPPTGDTMNIMIYALAITVSLLVLAILSGKKKVDA
jgi:pilin isopeptide linkage protein